MIRPASVVIALLLCTGAAFAADPCRFVVMGDNRPQWSDTDMVTPSAGYQRSVKEVNLLQPEFVIILGDLIHGYTNAAAVEQQWDAFDAQTKQFEMPVYLVVGNHDVFSKQTEQIYQRRYGRLWYSFEAKDCHFVVLDSEDQTDAMRIVGPQLEWLKSDLAAAKGKRIFVFVHQPLWGMKDSAFAKSEWGRTIHPLLAAAGVDTVFAGHAHQYTLQPPRDGVRYVISGGAGAELNGTPLSGGFLHYLLVTAPSQAKAKLAVIRLGSVEPEDVVTTDQAERAARFDAQFRVAPLLVEGQAVSRTTSWALTNPFPAPITGAISFADAAGWTASPRSCPFTLVPGGTCTLSFDLTADPATAESPLSYRVKYDLPGRGAGEQTGAVRLIRTVTASPMQNVTLDGALDEWTGDAPLRLYRKDQLWDENGVWEGPDSFSAQAWVGRDRRYLYVAVKAKDKAVEPTPADAKSAAGDAVTLYLDGRPKALLGRSEYAGGVGLMTITPGQPTRVFYPQDKSHGYGGVRAASQLTSDGYTVEIAVPLSEFPYHGDTLGLDLGVKDASSPKGEVCLFWHGETTDWRDASLFGRVRLR